MRLAVRHGGTEQCNQTLALALGQARVKQQLAAPELMVADQCPGIQAEAGVGQAEVVGSQARQLLQAPPEVVAQVADQAAGKGQFDAVWQGCPSQLCKAGAQALQVGFTAFGGLRCQGLHWPGAEQVETAALGVWAGAVEQHGTGCLADARKVGRRVGEVGQGMERTGRHASNSYECGEAIVVLCRKCA
ncbi:hypothetical protein D3C84_848840 [compost metagenome]